MRDDLLFLLDEELSSIQLCALHIKGTVSRILAKFRHRKWSSNSVKY